MVDVRSLGNNFREQQAAQSSLLEMSSHPMPSAGSLLAPEDVLRGPRELFLPLNCLFNGQLERGDETVIRPSTPSISNTGTNQLLTPCESAASFPLAGFHNVRFLESGVPGP